MSPIDMALDNFYKKLPALLKGDINKTKFLEEYRKIDKNIKILLHEEEALNIFYEVQNNIQKVRQMSTLELHSYLNALFLKHVQ